MQAGIVGASGYTGAELLRLCASHPELTVTVAGAESQAGRAVREVYPSLAAAYPTLVFTKATPGELAGLDVVFLALPHGESQYVVPDLVNSVGIVVDLSADFRLRDVGAYRAWYGSDHASPGLLGAFVYGLPELFRSELRGARLIAAPGCYPTAAALALAPLVRRGIVAPSGVVVDAASGVSGAGRGASDTVHFNAVDEDFRAYGLLHHRHTPEIEQATGCEVLFTPHLAPMNRGILATCYARADSSEDGDPSGARAHADPATGRGAASTAEVLDVLADAYAHDPFVVVSETSPSTKSTLGSNCAHVTARVDDRTGWVVAICALDNLVKGASGQAVQCANLALGLEETTGLPLAGMYP